MLSFFITGGEGSTILEENQRKSYKQFNSPVVNNLWKDGGNSKG